MSRRVLPLHLSRVSVIACFLTGLALFVLATMGANAAEPVVSTPSAWEYTYETAPAVERRPAASTAADLRLATGLSIAAVIVIATTLVRERQPEETMPEREIVPQRTPSPQPATIRPLAPSTTLPRAA